MDNVKKNNIPLPNLSLSKKLIYTVLILSSLIFYIYTWVSVLQAVYPKEGLAEADNFLGVALGVLAESDFAQYELWFALHSLSLAALLLCAFLLFKKTSLRRKVKSLIWGIGVILAIIDVSAWLRAPSCSSSNMYVGIAGILSAVPLIVLALTPLIQMWVYKRWQSPDGNVKRVVVIGGGFAGLYAALGLNRKLGYNQELEITLLDKKNYFLFPPLLPSAAAGSIETLQVSYPFRRIFETTNIIFRKVAISRIDPCAKMVYGEAEEDIDPISGERTLRETSYPFDYLVLAPGSVTQTFGTKGAVENAFFMRELDDAVALRNHVIDCFERAAVTDKGSEKEELLHFAIVGAGPTGIETATEIYDLIHHVLLKRYPEIDKSIPRVSIVQSGEQILPGWHSDIVRMANKQLSKMAVDIYLKLRVSEVGANYLALGEDKKLFARTIVWCAGVKPSELLKHSGLPLHSSGRVPVENDLRVKDHHDIFVLGDAAYLIDKKSGKPLPPLGQVAFQQGSRTASNIINLLSNKETKEFSYFDFGGLVSVGEHFAAVNLMGLRISGFLGWLIWRALYLAKLVGVSNKIRVLIDWSLDLLIERSISQIRDSEKLNSKNELNKPAAA